MSEDQSRGTEIALMFPGQGSQYVGMGEELADTFPVARQVFQEADDTLGFSLSSLCREGPEDRLQLTEYTQPAILTTSVAALRVLQQELDIEPSLVAGHSLGEYSALVAAGVIDFADAVRLVNCRGRFMQEATAPGVGKMAAIVGLDPEKTAEVCLESSEGQVVAPANFNCPGQVVIAGHAEAVDRAAALAKERGASRAIPLAVSAPFHCELMRPAAEKLKNKLRDTKTSAHRVPVVTNVEACANRDSTRVAKLLVDQVVHAVRWEESVCYMAANGVGVLIEVGPKNVLSGLARRINRSLSTYQLGDIATLGKLKEAREKGL